MKIEQKPQEVIQAQIADFTRSAIEDGGYYNGGQHQKVFANIGKLAAGPVENFTYEGDTKSFDRGTFELVSRPMQYTIEGAAYISHLRTGRASRNNRVRARAEYLAAYHEFDDVIRPILSRTSGNRHEVEQDEAHVGSGANAFTLGFEHNGKAYVAKVALGDVTENKAYAADDRFLDLLCGRGIPHLEQLVALSYEKGVAVMERMPGYDFFNVPTEVAARVTHEQLQEALATMRLAQKAGVVFDPSKASNNMYSAEYGFGFIDFGPERGDVPPQTYAEKVGFFVDALAWLGAPHIAVKETREDCLDEARNDVVRIAALEKMRTVCLAQPNQDEYREALLKIEQHIAHAQRLVSDVQTPGWLDKYPTREELARRRQQQAAQMGDSTAALDEI